MVLQSPTLNQYFRRRFMKKLSIWAVLSILCVGNQQKWDTFVKERSGGNGSVVGLPEQVVVAFAAG